MGWSGYQLRISVRVDAHGGEREERGERKYAEFMKRLEELCADPEFNDEDSISIIF